MSIYLEFQAAGTAIPSVARDLLEDDDRDDLSQQDYEKQVKWMCGALYGGKCIPRFIGFHY